MKLSLNVGSFDQILRLVLGAVLVALAYFEILSGTAAIIAYVVAAIAIITGLVKFCPLYAILGINSSKTK